MSNVTSSHARALRTDAAGAAHVPRAYRLAWRRLAAHLPADGALTVLDCGGGAALPLLAGVHAVTVGALETLERGPDGAFDLVLCLGVALSECAEPGATLRALVRAARPGGLVAVSVDGRLGHLRALAGDVDALAHFLGGGRFAGAWERLPRHSFTAERLRAELAAAGATPLDVWWPPTLAGHLLFDADARARLADPRFADDVVALALDEQALGTAAGSHHVYGIGRR